MKKTWLVLFLLFCYPVSAQVNCSNTSYGSGVTCITAGLQTTEINTWSNGNPPTGSTVIIGAYECGPAGTCADSPVNSLSIADNLHNPEPACTASPNSPFTLVFDGQIVKQYMWACQNIPAGITQFTANCSVFSGCTFVTLNGAAWSGLPTSGALWDVDGSGGSSGSVTSLSLSTSSSTAKTNELIFAFTADVNDSTMTPGSPYVIVKQGGSFSGNPSFAAVQGATSVATVTATWSPADAWYGTIGALRTSASSGVAPNQFPRTISAIEYTWKLTLLFFLGKWFL